MRGRSSGSATQGIAAQASLSLPQYNKEQLEQLEQLFALLQPSSSTSFSGGPSCSVTKSGNILSSLASWIIDSGASDHMTSHEFLFDDFRPSINLSPNLIKDNKNPKLIVEVGEYERVRQRKNTNIQPVQESDLKIESPEPNKTGNPTLPSESGLNNDSYLDVPIALRKGSRITHVVSYSNLSSFFGAFTASLSGIVLPKRNSPDEIKKIKRLLANEFEVKDLGMLKVFLNMEIARSKQGDQVFGFGSGKRGQLGISNDIVKSVCVPHKTLGLEDVNSMNIIANGDHSAALCSRKHLYIWGRGFNGAPDQHTPRCIETSFSISQAAIGWSHVLVLTGEGKIFMLGGYLGGALNKGDGTVINQHSANSEPAKEELMQEIDGLDNIRVQQIAAGAEHSAIVTENGSVMTCGWGEHGQLGLGNAIDQTVPQTVHIGQKLGNNEKILRVVYCGSGFTYTINKYSGNSHM
ncbi:guanyl-nucleotide exchange factor [Lithospermum erythrorhizon]|uniref:Guanyl-nucleotide exchange factor n=1 Tax=Lithospermum erythrorhizon TaxID=34254 RepID=A0AAV3NTA9_LITER